jgi:hypothetical protein
MRISTLDYSLYEEILFSGNLAQQFLDAKKFISSLNTLLNSCFSLDSTIPVLYGETNYVIKLYKALHVNYKY